MSRTVRRQHINKANSRSGHYVPGGFKTAGYYTQYDWHWNDPDWDGPRETYREPTKKERFKVWKWLHGESSHNNAFSPNWEYRKMRMRENRSINKQEIVRWMKDPDGYEPIFEADPRSCWYDWS